jgi:hypothetical protein
LNIGNLEPVLDLPEPSVSTAHDQPPTDLADISLGYTNMHDLPEAQTDTTIDEHALGITMLTTILERAFLEKFSFI